MKGVIDEEHIQVPILVIIEKGGLGGEPVIVQPIFRCFLGERQVSVINEEQVFSPGGIGVRRKADIDVHFTIAIDIHHGGAGAPAFLRGDAAFSRNIFEFKIPLIEEKPVVHHVSCEEDIGQPVVIDIPDGDAAPVVEINIIQYVQGFAVEKRILEVNPRLVLVKLGKEMGGLFPTAAGCQEERCQQQGQVEGTRAGGTGWKRHNGRNKVKKIVGTYRNRAI